jgi:hypothetical protein
MTYGEKVKVNKNIYKGQKVFFKDSWSNQVIKGIVTCTDNSTVAGIHCICFVDEDSRCIAPTYGDTNVMYGNLFETAKTAYAEVEKLSQMRIADMKQEIHTVEDLVKFPTLNCICGEDADSDAVTAYRERCQELLGVTL